MKINILSTYLILIVVLGFSCKSPQLLTVDKTIVGKKAFRDSLVLELLAPFPESTQIAIGIVNKSKVDHFGYVKKDSLCLPIENSKTLFEIGSITKVFTGIVLANTINNGQVSLTDTLSNLLPYHFKDGSNISIKNLTTHTSGIYSFPIPFAIAEGYNPKNPYAHISESMVKNYFENDFVLQNQPGENFGYSNLGVGILGYILAKKNAQSLMECYESIILDPIKMEHTCLEWQNAKVPIASPLTKEGEPGEHWTFHEIFAGAGGLLSNTFDMTHFITAVANNNIEAIEQSKTPLFSRNENTEICMNWFYSNLEGYGKWYWHGGGTGGFTSALFIDDNTDNGIIVLSNVSAFHSKVGNIEKIAMEYLKFINTVNK